MSKPYFSIIIPVYNARSYLQQEIGALKVYSFIVHSL